ncbi:MAG: hypothetical protein Q7S73_02270 [bacterium]|nr:hypothetical protein [bacterium]
MLFKFPKDDKNFSWTSHSKTKMLQYRISEQKIKTVLKNPSRKEEGVAPKTAAVMMRHDTPKRKEEIWAMYQELSQKLKGESRKLRVISVWRYPGVSPIGKAIPIPQDILDELTNMI